MVLKASASFHPQPHTLGVLTQDTWLGPHHAWVQTPTTEEQCGWRKGGEGDPQREACDLLPLYRTECEETAGATRSESPVCL